MFDARTLLHDLKTNHTTKNAHTNEQLYKHKHKWEYTHSSNISSASNITDIGYDNFNVVSIQSTARPGCIIELDKLADSNEYWQKADLCHVYQEELVYKKASNGRYFK